VIVGDPRLVSAYETVHCPEPASSHVVVGVTTTEPSITVHVKNEPVELVEDHVTTPVGELPETPAVQLVEYS
jgi:hypothetical protein